MDITEITRFKFDGNEYEELGKIKSEIQNRLGVIIDKMDTPSCRIGAAQKLHILEVLSNPDTRKQLLKLLNVTYECECGIDDHSIETKNILDLKKKRPNEQSTIFSVLQRKH